MNKISNKIKQINLKLANILKDKGIEANEDETTTQLVNKVQNIQCQNISKPYIDSSKLKNFVYMFASTYGTDLSLLENLDTSNGINFAYMFQNRTDLTELQIDTSSGTNFDSMFTGCTGLTAVTNLDVSNATNANSMFNKCTNLISCNELFFYNAKSLVYTFQNCSKIKYITITVSNKCTNMNSIFFGCNSVITVTINGDTSNAKTKTSMFAHCNKLETINGDISFVGDNDNLMFYNCGALKNIKPKSILKTISFQYSGLLTNDSAKAIISALVDYSGTENEYVYSVGFTDSVKTNLEIEGATAPGDITWLEYAQKKGWNI